MHTQSPETQENDWDEYILGLAYKQKLVRTICIVMPREKEPPLWLASVSAFLQTAKVRKCLTTTFSTMSLFIRIRRGSITSPQGTVAPRLLKQRSIYKVLAEIGWKDRYIFMHTTGLEGLVKEENLTVTDM